VADFHACGWCLSGGLQWAARGGFFSWRGFCLWALFSILPLAGESSSPISGKGITSFLHLKTTAKGSGYQLLHRRSPWVRVVFGVRVSFPLIGLEDSPANGRIENSAHKPKSPPMKKPPRAATATRQKGTNHKAWESARGLCPNGLLEYQNQRNPY